MLSECDKKDAVICFIGHQISVSEVRFDNIFVFRSVLIKEHGVSYFQLQLSICL